VPEVAARTQSGPRWARGLYREPMLAVHRVLLWAVTSICAVSWLLVCLTKIGATSPNPLVLPFAVVQLPAVAGLWVGRALLRSSPRR
jgi:hypothetical protein